MPEEELDKLDQYIFVIRVRIGKDADFYTNLVADNPGLDKITGDPTFHIDIKSEPSREFLTKFLQ
jgi:hypothetical protein